MGWHYNDLTANTGAPPASGPPMGYIFDAQGTQHVIYQGLIVDQGSDGRIHELWWDSNGWHHNDLTAAAGAPLAFESSSAYVFESQETQHVVYLGASPDGQGGDGHIHELWWDGNGWHHNDLTVAASAPPTATNALLKGYAFESNRTQHVFYTDDGGNIHELWWDDNGWHHNDLTAATGAPPAPFGGTDHVFAAQGTMHLFFASVTSGLIDGHIHELWWDNSGWHLNDLTVAAGAPLYGVGGLSSYVFADQGTQHVLYLGFTSGPGDYHIHELWWDSNGWHHNDLTVAAGAPPALGAMGYAFESQGTQHVVYAGGPARPDGDGHIHELWWDSGGWHHNDLTLATGAPLGAAPMGYEFPAQGTQHVVYTSNDNRIIELYWVPE